MGCVELLPTLTNGELWVRVHHIQKVTKGVVGITGFESLDYPLVEQLYHGGGVGQQKDHLDIRVSHFQVVDNQENLEHKFLFFRPGTSPTEG